MLILQGCALLQPGAAEPGQGPRLEGPTRSADAPPSALQVEVVAPPQVRELLEKNLDLYRMSTLAGETDLSDTELQRLVQAAPQQVRDLLQTEGLFNPTVLLQRVDAASAASRPTVRLEVAPGPSATVTRVDIEFEGPLGLSGAGESGASQTAAELRAGWALRAGMRFRNAAWAEAKTQLLARVRAAGYASATFSGTVAEVAPDGRTVRLLLVVDGGPLYLSGELLVEGLRMHEKQTVVNLADFGPGAVMTEARLLDFQDRLQKSGLFDRASVTLDTDPLKAAAAPVLVRVEESRAQQMVLGVGYSANTGQRATVEHLHRHLLGHAMTARNKAEWGRDRQAWEGEVSTHVRPGLRRWFAGGSLERLEGEDDVVVTQRVRFGRARDAPLLERLSFFEVDRSQRRTLLGRTDSVAYSLNQNVSLRRLDSPLLPTDGYTLSLQAGGGRARDSSGAQGEFLRLWGRAQAYAPLGSKWYGQARLEAGQVLVPSAVKVPESLRFRAGGDDSVRGYAYRSLGSLESGTVTGGKSVLTGSIELARPLSERLASFWGAVFVDAGNAAQTFSEWRAALGYGAGLRWRSPVGPLRLDLAYGREVQEVRLHFSVGIAF